MPEEGGGKTKDIEPAPRNAGRPWTGIKKRMTPANEYGILIGNRTNQGSSEYDPESFYFG
jgi:hypothetical protein